MSRPFIFRDASTELVLPVTPESYRVDRGVNVELVNIHELGDVVILGYGTLATVKIHCMLPARSYPYASGFDPDDYLEQLLRWVEQRSKLRFIVGNTGVNIPVAIENVAWGEEDGTGDIYADLVLREYRNLEAIRVTGPEENKSRAAASKPASETADSYTIQPGDTLSAICRKYYGDCSANTYNRLAAYNGIANPHLIYAGNSLRIPQPLP